MIGQEKNLEIIKNWRINRAVPRCIIIQGNNGSGRTTLAKEIAYILRADYLLIGNTINDIRQMIDNVHTVQDKTIYIIQNAGEMSFQAENSLLKIIEEPPNDSYFVLTCNYRKSVLPTIKSRSTVISMLPYTDEQLGQICDNDLLVKYIKTPGELLKYKNNDGVFEDIKIKTAEKLVDNIINAIQNKSGVDLLRLTDNLQSKDIEQDKINPVLFWNIFNYKLVEKPLDDAVIDILVDISHYVHYNSINLQMMTQVALLSILEQVKGGAKWI